MWSVYVLKSLKTGRFYTGMSQDVFKRLEVHNSGKVKSTKSGIPWVLHYQENSFLDSESSRLREKYLKSAAGKKWLSKIVKVY